MKVPFWVNVAKMMGLPVPPDLSKGLRYLPGRPGCQHFSFSLASHCKVYTLQVSIAWRLQGLGTPFFLSDTIHRTEALLQVHQVKSAGPSDPHPSSHT